MAEENFELIPHKDFLALKKDINSLKQNPFGPKTDEIISKIDNLSANLNAMTEAFKEASELTQKGELSEFTNVTNPLSTKLDAVMEQNKKIAQGILAVADLAKDALFKVSELELKLSKKEESPQAPKPVQEQHDFFSEIKPLSVPTPPPVSSFNSQSMQHSQSQSPQQMSQQPHQFSPPPLPNQLNSGQTQTGFTQSSKGFFDKKSFRFS